MAAGSTVLRPALFGVGGLCVVVAIVLLAAPLVGVSIASGPSVTSTDWEVGSGLVTMGAIQQVTGHAYWDTFCPASQGYCMDPVGIAVVPSASVALVTETTGLSFGGSSNGTNGFVEFDPVGLTLTASTELGCSPGIPSYPGTGAEVFMLCGNNSGTFVVSVDYRTASVVSSLPTSQSEDVGWSNGVTDPANGFLIWATGNDGLTVLDPGNNSVHAVQVPGASFDWNLVPLEIAFDPLTNELLVPASTGGFVAIDPGTAAVKDAVSLSTDVRALTVDPATDRLFVTTFEPSRLLVYNAATYALESTISIPNCVNYSCAEPNDVNQVLLDPTHGDAYLVATVALFTLNLSALSIVGSLEDYGNGPQWDSVFVPSVDRIFGTYSTGIVGPGFMVDLSYGSTSTLTTLLWLPAGIATILIGGAAGTCLAVALRRHPPRTEDEWDLAERRVWGPERAREPPV